MRYTRLTDKDMTVMQEQDSARDQHKQTYGALRDHSNQHRVEVFWDLNDECKKEQIFKLRIDDVEVLLDAEQMQRYLRWV
jgi:hypothetical protein